VPQTTYCTLVVQKLCPVCILLDHEAAPQPLLLQQFSSPSRVHAHHPGSDSIALEPSPEDTHTFDGGIPMFPQQYSEATSATIHDTWYSRTHRPSRTVHWLGDEQISLYWPMWWFDSQVETEDNAGGPTKLEIVWLHPAGFASQVTMAATCIHV
jgi:hypothetical protein